MNKLLCCLIFLCLTYITCQASPLVHTYSIVARDNASGQMGVAVQSHWFAVGSRVAWAEAGVGAIATQAMTNAQFGPKGLGLLTRGIPPKRVLKLLLMQDKGAENRQVAIIGTKGPVAVATGKKCISFAGHSKGDFFSVQANMMANDKVVPAMAKAFQKTKGELAIRLLAALTAAEKVGGDIRGCQSAAMKVVSLTKSGDPWQDTIVDIRVDDHLSPVKELSRLLQLSLAYRFRSKSGVELEKGNYDKAEQLFKEAQRRAPEKIEFSFWYALALAQKKQWKRAIPLFRKLFAMGPKWKEILERLPGSSGIDLPEKSARKLVQEIIKGCRSDKDLLRKLLGKLSRPPFGTCASLVAIKGNKRFSIVCGREKHKGKLISEKTLFNIASVTKTLTAARVVALYKEGKLELSAPVSRYLPGVTLTSATGKDVTSEITIAHLLKNRSGLPHQPGKQLNPAAFDNQWHSPELLKKLTKGWSLKLAKPPGEYHYSNMGFVLLAAIIEKVDHVDYATSMGNYLTSLGLSEHSFIPRKITKQAAFGRLKRDGKLVDWPPKFYSSVYALPFTGAWISMNSLANFGQLLTQSAKNDNASLHIMTKSYKDYRGYGLGIVHQKRYARKSLEHDGATNGFLCRLVVLLKEELVLAVATNGGGQTAAQKDFMKVTQQMLAAILTMN